MNFFTTLQAEILKTKRTASFYFTIAAAAFGPLMSLLDIFLDGIEEEHRTNILNELFTTKFQMTGTVVLPVFLILICTLLPQIEYKNHTWKQVLSSPQSKAYLFTAKYMNIHLLVILFFVVNQLLMLLVALVVHLKEPSLQVLQQPVQGITVIKVFINNYLALLPVSAIQFWMGLRFKNFLVPVALGIACWFSGTILVMQQTGMADYFPYSFPAIVNFPKQTAAHTINTGLSLLYTGTLLAIGYIDFKGKGHRLLSF